MSTPKRKIALFADVLEENFDGVSITLHKLLKRAPADRFEFLVITPHPPKKPEKIPYEIVVCNFINLPFQKGYRLGIPGKEVDEALSEFQPDLIHFTSPSLLGRYAIKYGKKNQVPVLNVYHTHFPAYLKYYIGNHGDWLLGPFIKYFVMWFYRNSNLTLVPTRPIKKDLMKLGIRRKKMHVWGRAIETGSFDPAFRDDQLFSSDIPDENKKVLFVSRLVKEKDLNVLLSVYRQLRRLDKTVTMVITGEGPKRKSLERKMPHALFTGKVTGNELAKVYASCDLFFFPSTSETFGNVIIEAMASGLPVVSAKAGGPIALVYHGKNGFLINPRDISGFTSHILQILNNPTLRKSMGQEAKGSVHSKSLEDLHNQLWKIYETTISRFHAKHMGVPSMKAVPELATQPSS